MEGGVGILLLLIIVVVGGGIAIALYVTGGALGSRSSAAESSRLADVSPASGRSSCAVGVNSRAAANPAAARKVMNGRLGVVSGRRKAELGLVIVASEVCKIRAHILFAASVATHIYRETKELQECR